MAADPASLSPEEELELDRLECLADPCYFIERHTAIEHPNGTTTPFMLWPFQREVITSLHNDREIIVLKSRRLGLSWVALGYALWTAIFFQGSRTLVLAQSERDASQLLGRVKRMQLRMRRDKGSAHLIEHLDVGREAQTFLELGESVIRALTASPAAARMETSALVVLDEFAYAPSASATWRAVYPTLEGGGRLACISTGHDSKDSGGEGAEFALQWERAESGDSPLKPHFFGWPCRPERDQEWKANEIRRQGSLERFKSEYPETPTDAFGTPDRTVVYPMEGISAAERLGRAFDVRQASLQLELPDDGLALGIDWGEMTVGLTAWELEGGGLYICDEVTAAHDEVSDVSQRMADTTARYGRLTEARYDAAGIQSMRTFARVCPDVYRRSVPFHKYKTETMNHLRGLFQRAAAGHQTRIIAISPRCQTLLRQLRDLQFADGDAGRIKKRADHAPDALIAAAAPLAVRARRLIVPAESAYEEVG